jgi:hypothetical protein
MTGDATENEKKESEAADSIQRSTNAIGSIDNGIANQWNLRRGVVQDNSGLII